MKGKLAPEIIDQIRASTGRLIEVAARFNVSTATITKYRPTTRGHLSDAERDQCVMEWLSHVPTRDTAARLGVHVETVQRARRRAMADLLREKSNGSA